MVTRALSDWQQNVEKCHVYLCRRSRLTYYSHVGNRTPISSWRNFRLTMFSARPPRYSFDNDIPMPRRQLAFIVRIMVRQNIHFFSQTFWVLTCMNVIFQQKEITHATQPSPRAYTFTFFLLLFYKRDIIYWKNYARTRTDALNVPSWIVRAALEYPRVPVRRLYYKWSNEKEL